jgi:hypothetical protein
MELLWPLYVCRMRWQLHVGCNHYHNATINTKCNFENLKLGVDSFWGQLQELWFDTKVSTWGCILCLQSPKNNKYQVENGRFPDAYIMQTTSSYKMSLGFLQCYQDVVLDRVVIFHLVKYCIRYLGLKYRSYMLVCINICFREGGWRSPYRCFI